MPIENARYGPEKTLSNHLNSLLARFILNNDVQYHLRVYIFKSPELVALEFSVIPLVVHGYFLKMLNLNFWFCRGLTQSETEITGNPVQ